MKTYSKKTYIWMLTLLAAVLTFSSCSKNNEDTDDVIVTKDYIVVEANPSITANTTTYMLEVRANCHWTMVANGVWDNLNFDTTSGDGNVNIVVSTSKNDQPDDRSCQIEFSNDDGSFKRSVTLTQTAGDFKVELEVDPVAISAIAAGGTKDFKVVSNTVWTVSVDATSNWCVADKVNGNKTEEVHLTIQQNQTPEERLATVTVSAGNRESNKKEFVIIVVQDAATVPALVVTEAKASDDLTKITGKASFSSMYDVTEYGYYIICEEIGLYEKHKAGTNGGTKGEFDFTITEIEDGRKYIIRAYAESVVGEGVSPDYPIGTTGDVPGNNDNPSPNLSRKK